MMPIIGSELAWAPGSLQGQPPGRPETAQSCQSSCQCRLLLDLDTGRLDAVAVSPTPDQAAALLARAPMFQGLNR